MSDVYADELVDADEYDFVPGPADREPDWDQDDVQADLAIEDAVAVAGPLHGRAALQRRHLPECRVDDSTGIYEDILAAAGAELERKLAEYRFLVRVINVATCTAFVLDLGLDLGLDLDGLDLNLIEDVAEERASSPPASFVIATVASPIARIAPPLALAA